MRLTAVSLFAGIGGFDLACQRAGIAVRAAVEIDPACRGVLAHRFPAATLFTDVREVSGDQLRATGFDPGNGVLTAGFPCQDLSVAGRRAGLGGARSGLFWQVVRLAGELQPRWIVLENVPGLLSAVCSCPGDGTCRRHGRAVACGRWDRGRWLARTVHNVAGGACRGGCMAVHGGAMGTVVGALAELGYGVCWRVLDAQFFGVPQQRDRLFVAGCLGDGAAPVEVLLEPEGGGGDSAPGRETRPGAPQRAADRAGSRGVVSTLQGGGRRGHRIDAEGAAGGQLVVAPFALRGRAEGTRLEPGREGDPAFTLRAANGGSSHAMIAHALTAGSAAGGGVSRPGQRRGDGKNLVARAFAENQRGEVVETETSHQLTAGAGKPGQGYAAVRTATGVRRLSPRERERLQGFPGDWTRWRLTSGHLAGQSDAARDRQTGNAVAVPVATWIITRLAAVHAGRPANPATPSGGYTPGTERGGS